MSVTKDFEKQLYNNYRLTTANIFYHLPDYPELLQEYIWQEYDLAPKFPALHDFLDFWAHELDGKLHSVYVASKKLIMPNEHLYYNAELTLQ